MVIDRLAKDSLKSGLRLVTFQLCIVCLIVLISTVFFSSKSGYSALAGAITFMLPNCIFIWMSLAHAGARQSRLVLRGFYVGEAIKVILTVILLIIFLVSNMLDLAAFYISFLLLIVSQCFAALFFKQQ